jgi:hypothetical protein
LENNFNKEVCFAVKYSLVCKVLSGISKITNTHWVLKLSLFPSILSFKGFLCQKQRLSRQGIIFKGMFSESPKIISMVFESSLPQFSSSYFSIPAEMSNPIIFSAFVCASK